MASQDWVLFGYDLRAIGRYWRQGWHDALWGQNAWLRTRLEQRVAIRCPDDKIYYTEGYPGKDDRTRAYALPAAHMLERRLILPAALEADLGNTVSMEVRANSPFPDYDTRYGWRILKRSDGKLHLLLVIVSHATVMGWLQREHGIHEQNGAEIWAISEQEPVLINGYAEQLRHQHYQQRIKALSVWSALTLTMVVALFSLPAAYSYAQLQKYERWHTEAQQHAAEAIRHREELLANSDRATNLQMMLANTPSVYIQLHQFSTILEDNTWLQQFDMRGKNIKLTGHSNNATDVLQKIAEQPGYAEVKSPSGFRRDERTGLESFTLDIRLQGAP